MTSSEFAHIISSASERTCPAPSKPPPTPLLEASPTGINSLRARIASTSRCTTEVFFFHSEKNTKCKCNKEGGRWKTGGLGWVWGCGGRAHVRAHSRIHACTHMHTHTCTRTHTCRRIHTRTTHARTHTYIHTHSHTNPIFTPTHMYTHTHKIHRLTQSCTHTLFPTCTQTASQPDR